MSEAINLHKIHEDISKLRRDVSFIKHIISEEFELSDWAKKQLKKARSTPDREYINQKEMEKEFLS